MCNIGRAAVKFTTKKQNKPEQRISASRLKQRYPLSEACLQSWRVTSTSKQRHNIQILLSVAGLSVIMFNLSFKSRFWRLGYQEEKQKFKWITICVYVVCSIIQIKS